MTVNTTERIKVLVEQRRRMLGIKSESAYCLRLIYADLGLDGFGDPLPKDLPQTNPELHALRRELEELKERLSPPPSQSPKKGR